MTYHLEIYSMESYAIGGRKRAPSNHTLEDQALDQIAKQLQEARNKTSTLVLDFSNCLKQNFQEAESRLAARRQARAEAREIRMREIERQQREAEENADKVFNMHNAVESSINRLRNASCVNNRNASMISTPGSNSSRRSSEDSLEDSFNYRDAKHELKELAEKFRKAMIQNAQLDNEKSAIAYQVELFKDKYQDLEAAYSVLHREHKEKCREHEQLKRLLLKQKEDLAFFRSQIEERDRLIEEQGLLVITNEEENGLSNSNDEHLHNDTNHIEYKRKLSNRLLISSKSAALLHTLGEGSLDDILKKYAQERKELLDEMTKLRFELEEERIKSSGNCFGLLNGSEHDEYDESKTSRLVDDYKFKWQKADQDISTLQANVARLESQVIRYKSAAETSEKVEDELKVEKRKLQRELREAQSRGKELETANTHLQRRLDKLKDAKSALLKEI